MNDVTPLLQTATDDAGSASLAQQRKDQILAWVVSHGQRTLRNAWRTSPNGIATAAGHRLPGVRRQS